MTRARFALALCAISLAIVFANGTARAQSGSADAIARALVRDALDAYQNLEIDTAMARLRDAQRRCGRRNCSGRVAGEVQVAVGIVAVGGRSDRDAGLRAFTAALAADPNATVDPVLATPDITAVFNRARRGNTPRPSGRLLHTAVQEQLVRTPTPIYIETGVNAAVRVDLFYRRAGASSFDIVPMQRVVRGWGATIPCAAVQSPAVEYYVWAYDQRDNAYAAVGDEESPLRIEVVRQRTRPAPSMPGELPPSQCADTTPRAGEGGECNDDLPCADGLQCDVGVCHAQQHHDAPATSSDYPLVAIDLGGGLGIAAIGGTPAYDEADMPVDPANPDGPVRCQTGFSCPTNASGAGLTGYFTLSARFHVHPRIGVGASLRLQPDFGPRTTLSMLLIGLEGYYLFVGDHWRRDGFSAMALLGIGVGQIQPRAPEPTAAMMGIQTGHIITGLQNVHVGGRIEYAFHPKIHAGLELRLQFLWPRFLFDTDLQATIGVQF